MIAALERKLLRDLWQMKGQMTAIGAVLASGVALFVCMLSTLDSLQRSMNSYYAHYRFADVFAGLKRAPEHVRERLEAIPGVGVVDTRVVAAVTLDVPNTTEAVVGRLVSLPDRGEPRLNAVFVRTGSLPSQEHRNEVLVSEGFAKAHHLRIGDKLPAILNGRRQSLRVSGTGLSPEYVYSIKPGGVFPDDRLFGILWMRRKALEAAFDMEGAFNDVSIQLMHGASSEDVRARVDEVLDRFGGLGAYDRSDQVSNWYLHNEINQLRHSGLFIPLIFLGVAAFLLNVVFSRVVQTQRDQIAVLKAFGYGRVRIGAHYLLMVLGVVVAGSAIGAAAGAWMGEGMTHMYTQFFHFPVLVYRLAPSYVGQAVLIGIVAGMAGALHAIHRAIVLPPAEAMRPEAPPRYRPTLAEQLGLRRFLSPSVRMVMRHMERRPVKTAFSVVGLALGVAIMILGRFSLDAMRHMMDVQFRLSQHEDVSVNLTEPRTTRALYELERFPGVVRAEGIRSVPVRLRAGHRSRRCSIEGWPAGNTLQQLLDTRLAPVPMPRDGIVLTTKLAELLDVKAGDRVRVEVLDGKRPKFELPIARIAEVFIGFGAYMHLDALNRVMQEPTTFNAARLLLDPRASTKFNERVKQTPAIAGIGMREDEIKSFEETVQESMSLMNFFNVLFSVVIAFGVVYNNTRIALAEHGRELATLRVLGFRRNEVAGIFLGELAVQTLIAIPVGLVLGYGLCALLVKSLDTELFRIPLFITSSTYAIAAITLVVAAVVSGLVVRRRLDKMDIHAALKTRE